MNAIAEEVEDHGPTDEQMIQAVLFLLEGHAVPRRYLDRLRALLDAQDPA